MLLKNSTRSATTRPARFKLIGPEGTRIDNYPLMRAFVDDAQCELAPCPFTSSALGCYLAATGHEPLISVLLEATPPLHFSPGGFGCWIHSGASAVRPLRGTSNITGQIGCRSEGAGRLRGAPVARLLGFHSFHSEMNPSSSKSVSLELTT
ncbi:hypothetical protein NM208_g10645 [Fusarium decemcellulare]|uniref:Uncharacterized protein n=1 Tax=Fusarium decemcellulare TaxID=57161 RepID=A0ACC1RX49_9HYPO|nr:hypothetical protein NM208_g10645 [Fusarium decemcellulare]